jgi:cytochrome c oxidase assembly factor CtaG
VSVSPAPVAEPPRTRSTRVTAATVGTLIAGALALGAAALAVTAVVRALIGAHGPVLPYALCRSGHAMAVLPELTAGRLLTTWQWDPVALVVIGGSALLYAAGIRQLATTGQDWQRWRIGSFAAGLAVVGLATCSSIAVYDMTLFWSHMVQHLMLIMVAPVLIVAGRPLTLWMASSTPPHRERHERFLRSWPIATLTSPGVALALYAAVIVGAHLTGITDDVLGNAWSGQLEHVVYLISGVLFFGLVFGDEPIRWRLSMPGRLMLLMLAMAVDTFVGVVLLQSTTAVATIAHPAWGLTPLQDTQAGGAVMWVGGDGLMAFMAIGLYVTWARRPEAARRIVSVFERVRSGLAVERSEAVAAAAPRPASAVGTQGTEGAPPPAPSAGIDDDEREWEAYNRWLAQLNRKG